MIRLRVWANARPMGWFGHEAGEFFFEYEPQWLGQPGDYVLAPQFPLSPQRFRGWLVRNFFENLLPEGQVLEDVIVAINQHDASPFDVLGALGKELPGVLSLLPENPVRAQQQTYAPLSNTALSQRIT